MTKGHSDIRVCTMMMTKTRLAATTRDLWKRGDAITASFFGGSLALQGQIIKASDEWSRYTCVDFHWLGDNNRNAAIRIGFKSGGGSWSYVGKSLLAVSDSMMTMNFGWFGGDTADMEIDRVTKHEFGHALGFIHEHQNPAGGIPWNREAVYTWYEKNFLWSRAVVDYNVFALYDKDQTNYTEVDPKSIMMYWIPPELTQGEFATQVNYDFSDTDRRFARELYQCQERDHTTLPSQSEG